MSVRRRALLVDMGGVLIDFLGGRGLPVGRADWRGREALLQFIAARGARLSLEELDLLVFAGWRAEYERRVERNREASWNPFLKRLRQRAGIRTHSLVLLRTWFRPFREQLQPLPGVRAALSELQRRGHRMALVSNVPLPGRLYAELLDRRELLQYFDSLHFSYDEGHRKPSPALLRSALAALAVEPGRAVMVGDRRSVDVIAGKAAGVATVWVRSDDSRGPEPDFTIDALPGLLDVV